MDKILKRLKEELSEYQEGLEQFQECDVEQNDEYIIQGWCEALEFTIKLIESEDVYPDEQTQQQLQLNWKGKSKGVL